MRTLAGNPDSVEKSGLKSYSRETSTVVFDRLSEGLVGITEMLALGSGPTKSRWEFTAAWMVASLVCSKIAARAPSRAALLINA